MPAVVQIMPMSPYRVRHLALGHIAEHQVQAKDAQQAVAAVSALLGRAVLPADVLQVQAVPGLGAGPAVVRHEPGVAAPSGRQGNFPQRLFCQELAVLLDAGIPLLESLQTLQEKEASPHVAGVLSDLCEALSQGQSLAQAMRARPAVFSTLLVSSVEASARTGQTALALKQQAAYLMWVEGMRQKLISAAIYPAILVSASALVMLFLTVFVVPRFAEIYDGMGGDLPWLSGLLLRMGVAVGAHPWQAMAWVVAVVATLVMVSRLPRVRAAMMARVWQLPVVGERLRLLELATLYRTLGLLLQAGVPVLSALQSSRDLVGPSLRAALDQAAVSVSQGGRLSDALARQALATPVSLRMIRVGESTGELGPMLERAALFYDEELANFTEWVGKVLSPVLMLIMGLLIGGIVVLMYLPIFQVAEQIQ